MNKKRFIAGAICPQCHLIDKIVVYQQAEANFAECVRCGYKQEQQGQVAPRSPSVDSKVNIATSSANKLIEQKIILKVQR